jgi:hypothetical protein
MTRSVADDAPIGIHFRRQRQLGRKRHLFLDHRETYAVATEITGEVDLIGTRLDRREQTRGVRSCRRSGLRQRLQARNGNDGNAAPQTDPLRNAGGDTYAGERARSTTKCHGIEIGGFETRRLQQRIHHLQNELIVLSRRDAMIFDDGAAMGQRH